MTDASNEPMSEDQILSANREYDDTLVIGGQEFTSRLFVGTGKYKDNETMVKAIQASGAAMVTVAVRRVDLDRTKDEGILYHLDPNDFFLLPNTAGCYTAEDAIRYARLAPHVLVEEGFKVMAYTNDDLIMALRLEDAGCVAVMPLASPIGSGLGVVNPYFIREIKRRCEVPIIVDAGVGTASDVCVAMEQGIDGVLLNTAIAAADDPVAMGEAMGLAVRAGRLAFLAGRMPSREIAVPSSPGTGMLD